MVKLKAKANIKGGKLIMKRKYLYKLGASILALSLVTACGTTNDQDNNDNNAPIEDQVPNEDNNAPNGNDDGNGNDNGDLNNGNLDEPGTTNDPNGDMERDNNQNQDLPNDDLNKDRDNDK